MDLEKKRLKSIGKATEFDLVTITKFFRYFHIF